MIFLHENLLFALIIPFILFFFSIKPGQNSIKIFFSQAALNQLSVNKNVLHNSLRYKLFLLTTALFILSLARPVTEAKIISDRQGLSPVIIAIDLSKSMYVKDVYPDRLSLAKQKAKAFISNGIDMRIGLILFAKDAYTAYPLSEDLDALEYTLDNLEHIKKLEAHSNIFSALEGANHMLRTYTKKDILLLSDGGNSDDVTEEIRYLQENNITLHAICIATQKGERIPQTASEHSKSKPTLKTLSRESGGVYQDYSWGNHDINAIVSKIKENAAKHKLKASQFKHYTELFSYPLAVAVALLFFVFFSPLSLIKKGSTPILISISLVFLHTKAYSDIMDFKTIKDAKKLYAQQKFLSSAELYKTLPPSSEQFYNRANALYKAQKYEEAINLYKKSLSDNEGLNAKIFHNIGNAYFQLKRLSLAKKYYEKSLKISGHPLTQENLDILTQVLHNIKKKKREKPIPLSGMSKGPGLGKGNFDEAPSSDYEVQIEGLVLSEEDRWIRLLQQQQSMIFLQKLDTKRMSKNATKAW